MIERAKTRLHAIGLCRAVAWQASCQPSERQGIGTAQGEIAAGFMQGRKRRARGRAMGRIRPAQRNAVEIGEKRRGTPVQFVQRAPALLCTGSGQAMPRTAR